MNINSISFVPFRGSVAHSSLSDEGMERALKITRESGLSGAVNKTGRTQFSDRITLSDGRTASRTRNALGCSGLRKEVNVEEMIVIDE